MARGSRVSGGKVIVGESCISASLCRVVHAKSFYMFGRAGGDSRMRVTGYITAYLFQQMASRRNRTARGSFIRRDKEDGVWGGKMKEIRMTGDLL